MITRVLPPEEWHKLSVTGSVHLTDINPKEISVVVVEDDEVIVGIMEVARVTHLESLWVHPDYRGRAGTARKLMDAAFEEAEKMGDPFAWGCSDTELMSTIIPKLGAIKLDVESYMIPLRGKELCPQQ